MSISSTVRFGIWIEVETSMAPSFPPTPHASCLETHGCLATFQIRSYEWINRSCLSTSKVFLKNREDFTVFLLLVVHGYKEQSVQPSGKKFFFLFPIAQGVLFDSVLSQLKKRRTGLKSKGRGKSEGGGQGERGAGRRGAGLKPLQQRQSQC